MAYLGEHGYATCPPATAAGDRLLVEAVLALVVELTQQVKKTPRKLGQLQPYLAVFPQECVGQLGSFGPT